MRGNDYLLGMASDGAQRRDADTLPPRHSLPRDVLVPTLPGLGLTWYDRGSGYWIRCAALALMWAVVTTFLTLITLGILAAIHRRSQAGFLIAVTVEVAYSAGLLAFFAARTARYWNDPAPAGPARRPRPSGAPAIRRGAAAGIGHAAGQVFLAFGFLVIGFYLGFFITALLPETLVERRTRLRGRGTAPPRCCFRLTPGKAVAVQADGGNDPWRGAELAGTTARE